MILNEASVRDIFDLVKNLRFGEVIIKVQDARIVSVEKREKIRLKAAADSGNNGEARN